MASKPLGFIYILTNPGIPGLVKIGRSTNDPDLRAKALHATGVPTPFVVEYKGLYEDYAQLEKRIHDRLESRRPARNREFFKIPVAEAILRVREIAEKKPKYEEVIYVSDEVLARRAKAEDARAEARHQKWLKDTFQARVFTSASLEAYRNKRRFSMKAVREGVRVGHRKGGEIGALRGWIKLGQDKSYCLDKALIQGGKRLLKSRETSYFNGETSYYWRSAVEALRKENRMLFEVGRVKIMLSEKYERPDPCVSLVVGDFVECELIDEPLERFKKVLAAAKADGLTLRSSELINVCFTAEGTMLCATYEGKVANEDLEGVPGLDKLCTRQDQY